MNELLPFKSLRHDDVYIDTLYMYNSSNETLDKILTSNIVEHVVDRRVMGAEEYWTAPMMHHYDIRYAIEQTWDIADDWKDT